MSNAQKRRAAGLLGLVAVVLLTCGLLLWRSAETDADAKNSAGDEVANIVGEPPPRHVNADTTLPLILVVAGGFSLLSAVILLAGTNDR